MPVGKLIDRFSVRHVLALVVLLLGVSVLGMGLFEGAVSLFFALLLIRQFGQSALSVVSMVINGKWFKKHLGGAMGLFYQRLGDIHCFQAGGVELREMRLEGFKPLAGNQDRSHQVMYRGPLAKVVDEAGIVYPRGQRVTVDSATWNLLRRQPFAEEFTCFACTAD